MIMRMSLPKEWKQGARTLIWLRRRSPNAVFHFLRQPKISLKLYFSGFYFDRLFKAFSWKVARGIQCHTPECPQDMPKWSPKVPPKCTKDFNCTPCDQNGSPKCHNGAQDHPKCQSNATRPCKVPQNLETSEGGKPKVQLGAVGRRPRQQGSDASSSW